MAINVTRMDFFVRMPRTDPPPFFSHNPPPEDASRPAMPGTLTGPEAVQVNQWLIDKIDAAVTLANAITKRNAFKTYFASTPYAAWRVANHLARESQWHWARVDASILNYPTVAPSSIDTGVGSDPPPGILPRQEP